MYSWCFQAMGFYNSRGDKIVPLPPTRTGWKSHLSFTWCVANHGAPSVRAPVGATDHKPLLVILSKTPASFALCQAGYKDLRLQDKAKDFGFSPCFPKARSLLQGSLGLGRGNCSHRPPPWWDFCPGSGFPSHTSLIQGGWDVSFLSLPASISSSATRI